MININMLSFVAIIALFVSLASGCTYNIASLNDVTTALNDQAGWTTVPTLCFAAGTYNFQKSFNLTASQNWVGPKQGVDPSCGRLINPPCSRFTSASTPDPTIEAVFNSSSYGVQSQSVHNLNFTMDGFSVISSSVGFAGQNPGMGFSVTIKNTYGYGVSMQVDYLTLDQCYFSAQNPYVTVITSAISSTITNSFFSSILVAKYGSVTAIGNTFTFAENVFELSGPSYLENNAFYGISSIVIQDSVGKTSFKGNTFWVTNVVYEPSVLAHLNFDSNCIVAFDENDNALYFFNDLNTTDAVFNNNYFGDPNGPQINYISPGTAIGNQFALAIQVYHAPNFTFTYSPKPLHFAAPNVCPPPPISLTVKPNNIEFGETVNISLSFSLDPLIVGAGITPSMFDGITVQLYLYIAQPFSFTSVYLNAFDGNSQTTWNPSTQKTLSVAYTFQLTDLQTFTAGVLSPPNYYVYYSLQQNSGGPLSIYYSYAYAPITITPKVPLECYNMTLSINKNVTAAPRKYNFQQLGCSSSDWQIISVNRTNLFSFDNNQNLLITTGRNASGLRLARYQVSFFAGSINGQFNLVHNVITQFMIVNHSPVIHSANFTWYYPRTTQTFPNWNLLTNCSDSDGDNVTVVQIQKTQARTDATVVQLDDFTLYFVTEKVVVSVLPTGQITFTAPSNSNPVTAGSPLPLFWKQDIRFQFQITDGDVSTQYAWGVANINYV